MKLLPLAVALTVAALTVAGTGIAASAADAGPRSIFVEIAPIGSSGESGKAELTESGGDLHVSVSMKHPVAPVQPIHIHAGTCHNANPNPAYSLGVLSNGYVTDVLKGVALSSLLGKYVIIVHNSTKDMGTYVSCGAIH
jgi:hypothetical protein